jgi:hypothetical protein
MNNKQLAELQQDVVAALKKVYNEDSFTVDPYDVGAGITVDFKNSGIRKDVWRDLITISDKHSVCFDVYDQKGHICIEMASDENGGLTDEENAPHGAFEKYQADGGQLTYEEWAKENGVE